MTVDVYAQLVQFVVATCSLVGVVTAMWIGDRSLSDFRRGSD